MNDITFECTICESEVFVLIAGKYCSVSCMYKHKKDSLEVWTPRSVMDKIFTKIKRDSSFIASLRRIGSGILLFETQDFEMLCTLLSNTEDWKQTILSGCEPHPCDRFLLWFISKKGESAFCEL